MNESAPRVQLTIGARATFHLDRMVARLVGLAGMQMKCEVMQAVTGTLVRGTPVPGETTPEGKPEIALVVRADDGAEYELRRSWIRWCEVAS